MKLQNQASQACVCVCVCVCVIYLMPYRFYPVFIPGRAYRNTGILA